MRFLRQFLVLAALMFWQGGFVFYAGVVVPIGTEVLGSAQEQGRITRRVAVWLNWSGAAALVPLGWDAYVDRRHRLARRGRLMTWFVMAAALAVLFWMYPTLDAMFDPEAVHISNRPSFRTLHRIYLWMSSVQWVAGVAFAALTLWAWTATDRGESDVASKRD
jgi:hypothetical protein